MSMTKEAATLEVLAPQVITQDMFDSYSKVEQEAASWFLAMQQPDISDKDKAAFMQWLKAGPNNQSEYFRLRKIWQALPEALAQSTAVKQLTPKSTSAETTVKEKPKTIRLWHYASAACLCLALLIAQPWSEPIAAEYYASQAGQTRLIELTDGSTIKLNNQSKVIIEYSKQQRLIRLVNGEAYFTVTKAKNRPFIVKHDNYHFTALGTEFLLRINQSIKLIVTEHSVAVNDNNGRNAVVKEASGIAISTGINKEKSWQTLPNNKREQLLAWRKQQLIFTKQPLREVLVELDRYLQGSIHLSDANMANEPITGIFTLDNPENVLKLITEVLGLTLYQSKNKDYFVG